MQKEDLFIVLLALALAIGMLLTWWFRDEKSMHGHGSINRQKSTLLFVLNYHPESAEFPGQ